MSSRASPIPSDAFDRPSSPRPPTSPPPGRSRAIPSVSPFKPIILPSSHSRPIVRRQTSQAGSNGAIQVRPFGEIGKEDDDSWEKASIMSSSSWGGGRGREGSDEGEVEKPFLPRLRDLRSARPRVRKEEREEGNVVESNEAAKDEEPAVPGDNKEGLDIESKEVEKPKDPAEVEEVDKVEKKQAATTENSTSG